MQSDTRAAASPKVTELPMYYRPWPHQVGAWRRRRSGLYTYDVKLWCRQAGKDTDDIQWNLRYAWDHPGTQSTYVGLDNVWINNNIFKKYIDGRPHWSDYPEEYIDPKETQKEVYMRNNPPDLAPARIKFIGFLNDEGLIGSSYDSFTFSETSLYKRNAFQYMEPIWDRKLALGAPLQVLFNGTPRGMRNVYYDILRTYTGVDDPDEFPGAHEFSGSRGNCYVDKVTIEDLVVPDGHGGFRKMYTERDIEDLAARYERAYGDLNLFWQENYVRFTTVNSGLVYRAIEDLRNEGRFCPTNLDTSRPVYMAWDISSKGKTTDATSCVVFQYINGRMVIYDWLEARGKALVECVQELAARPYFHLIRFAALPWDSERSASSETPIEECRKMFPNINWHSLDQERVDRGINLVRRLLPNMVINSDKCDWVMECFESWEYNWLGAQEDWSAKPRHDRYSHLMDAVRYAAMAMSEIDYLQLNANGVDDREACEYEYFGMAERPKPSTMRRMENRRDSLDVYGY